MEEKSTATLEKIQRAAMEEFFRERLSGCLPAADREAGRCHHRRTIWLFLQQGGRSLPPSWSLTPLR